MSGNLVQWMVDCVVFCLAAGTATATDPLPSWNESKTKRAILESIELVTDLEGDQYVLPAARIAAFDNGGTLWAERPVPF